MNEKDFMKGYQRHSSGSSPGFTQNQSSQWGTPVSSTATLVSRYSGSAIDRCYYFGIDFGTTYSGVAWAWSGDPNNVHLITNWPRGTNNRVQDNAKAPTKLIYYSGNSVGWGYEVNENEPLEWFKLLLLKDEDIPDDFKNSLYLKTARARLRKEAKTPEEAITDYLRKLWEHAVSCLERERGKAAVDGLPFRVVITIPAIWKPYAKVKMREAAERAGITRSRPCGSTTLNFVSEPEAAALSTLSEKREDIRRDDIYIVCDAGGGTVDIITYKIESTYPLKFRECVRGKGKLCGAIFADEEFEKLIKGKLGSNWDRMSLESRKRIMNLDWELGIKRNFSPSSRASQSFHVEVPADGLKTGLLGNKKPDDKKKGISNGKLLLSSGLINGVFQKSVNQISLLVYDQIREVERKEGMKPKAIILVGGFGACDHLYETLRNENQHKGIQVLQPRDKGPWAAICKGAVIRAREVTFPAGPSGATSSTVISRVSRYHYGTAASQHFRDGVHDPQDLYRCDIEGIFKARNQMHWYLRMNTNVLDQQPVKFQYYRHFPGPARRMSMDIYQCEEELAPNRMTGAVRKLCTVTCELRIDFQCLPTVTSPNGRTHYVLEFEVEMHAAGGSSVEFSILVGGVRQGKQDVQVDFR